MSAMKDAASIVGIGHTEYSKNSGRSELQLAAEASRAAIRDADVILSAGPAGIPILTAEDLKSAPKLLITVRCSVRASPVAGRARRKSRIASMPYRFSATP